MNLRLALIPAEQHIKKLKDSKFLFEPRDITKQLKEYKNVSNKTR